MIKVMFLYRNTDGSRFDMDYYLNTHLKLSKEVFAGVLRGISLERGLSSIEPGSKPPFHVTASLLFDSVEDFYSAMMPRLDDLKADAAKYTNAETLIQIGQG